jgi:hypothetical protein
MSYCPISLGYYADNTTFKCTLNCPNGFYKDSTSGNCVDACPYVTIQYYADPNTKSCV